MSVKIPKAMIKHLDKKIKLQEKRVKAAQAYLDELHDARQQLEPIKDEVGHRYLGGAARANALTPGERSQIAARAAKTRWRSTRNTE